MAQTIMPETLTDEEMARYEAAPDTLTDAEINAIAPAAALPGEQPLKVPFAPAPYVPEDLPASSFEDPNTRLGEYGTGPVPAELPIAPKPVAQQNAERVLAGAVKPFQKAKEAIGIAPPAADTPKNLFDRALITAGQGTNAGVNALLGVLLDLTNKLPGVDLQKLAESPEAQKVGGALKETGDVWTRSMAGNRAEMQGVDAVAGADRSITPVAAPETLAKNRLEAALGLTNWLGVGLEGSAMRGIKSLAAGAKNAATAKKEADLLKIVQEMANGNATPQTLLEVATAKGATPQQLLKIVQNLEPPAGAPGLTRMATGELPRLGPKSNMPFTDGSGPIPLPEERLPKYVAPSGPPTDLTNLTGQQWKDMTAGKLNLPGPLLQDGIPIDPGTFYLPKAPFAREIEPRMINVLTQPKNPTTTGFDVMQQSANASHANPKIRHPMEIAAEKELEAYDYVDFLKGKVLEEKLALMDAATQAGVTVDMAPTQAKFSELIQGLGVEVYKDAETGRWMAYAPGKTAYKGAVKEAQNVLDELSTIGETAPVNQADLLKRWIWNEAFPTSNTDNATPVMGIAKQVGGILNKSIDDAIIASPVAGNYKAINANWQEFNNLHDALSRVLGKVINPETGYRAQGVSTLKRALQSSNDSGIKEIFRQVEQLTGGKYDLFQEAGYAEAAMRAVGDKRAYPFSFLGLAQNAPETVGFLKNLARGDIPGAAVNVGMKMIGPVTRKGKTDLEYLDEIWRAAQKGHGIKISPKATGTPMAAGTGIPDLASLSGESAPAGRPFDPKEMSQGLSTKEPGLLDLFGNERGAVGTGPAINPQLDTPEFKAWFGNSKVVDESGDAATLYHGTTHRFDTFDPEKANVENDFGKGIYLTNNAEDVSANYAGIGPDLTGRIERRAEEIVEKSNNDYRYGTPEYKKEYAAAKKKAEKELSGKAANIMPVRVSMQNPLKLGGPDETRFEIIFDEATGEESGNAIDFINSLRQAANKYNDVDIDKALEDITEYMYDGSAADVIDKLKKSEGIAYATDDVGNLTSSELIREAIEGAGFDGIIDRTVDIKFGGQRKIGKAMAGMNEDTYHVIAFSPNQIKSATGNSGAFSPSNPSIAGNIAGPATGSLTGNTGVDILTSMAAPPAGGIAGGAVGSTIGDTPEERKRNAGIGALAGLGLGAGGSAAILTKLARGARAGERAVAGEIRSEAGTVGFKATLKGPSYSDPIFSNAQRAIEEINMPKAPASQWLKMLDPTSGRGTKADEMKWTGLDDYLKGKGNESVTKAELEDFMARNKVVLEEVRKGDMAPAKSDYDRTLDARRLARQQGITIQWAMDITPAMRQSVTEQGLPMFVKPLTATAGTAGLLELINQMNATGKGN